MEGPIERFWKKYPHGYKPGIDLWKNKKKDAVARSKELYRLSEKGRKARAIWRKKNREQELAKNREYKASYRLTEKWQKDLKAWQERINRDGRLKKWKKVIEKNRKERRAGNEKWAQLVKDERKWKLSKKI